MFHSSCKAVTLVRSVRSRRSARESDVDLTDGHLGGLHLDQGGLSMGRHPLPSRMSLPEIMGDPCAGEVRNHALALLSATASSEKLIHSHPDVAQNLADLRDGVERFTSEVLPGRAFWCRRTQHPGCLSEQGLGRRGVHARVRGHLRRPRLRRSLPHHEHGAEVPQRRVLCSRDCRPIRSATVSAVEEVDIAGAPRTPRSSARSRSRRC